MSTRLLHPGNLMVIVRARQGGVLILWLTVLLALRQPLVAQSPHTQSPHAPTEEPSEPLFGQPAEPLGHPLGRLIGQLDHDSFPVRQSAARKLLQLGLVEWRRQDGGLHPHGGLDGEVIASLRRGLEHESVEVRLAAARILREIGLQTRQEQVDQLLNPHLDPSTIRLQDWPEFSRFAGDDMLARTAFAHIARRFGDRPVPGQVRRADSDRLRRLADRLDPYRLDPEDTTAWMLLLTLDLEHRDSLAHLTPRLAAAMSHCPMGPLDDGSSQRIVLGRLIDQWVRHPGHLCGSRERLLVAMRYHRREAAGEVCLRVLEDEAASPAATVTGLLAAAVLQSEHLEQQALRRLTDDRVAHVWQLIPSSKTRIRTEVRDVALALLLDRHGIDPRRVGYVELQADPLWRYREHSLGFPDDQARAECHRRAAEILEFLR